MGSSPTPMDDTSCLQDMSYPPVARGKNMLLLDSFYTQRLIHVWLVVISYNIIYNYIYIIIYIYSPYIYIHHIFIYTPYIYVYMGMGQDLFRTVCCTLFTYVWGITIQLYQLWLWVSSGLSDPWLWKIATIPVNHL